jgi:hypothetical protein
MAKLGLSWIGDHVDHISDGLNQFWIGGTFYVRVEDGESGATA